MGLILMLSALPLLGVQAPAQESENRPQDEELLPPFQDFEDEHFFLEARGGAWSFPGFEAQTVLGLRKIRKTTLLDAGFDAGYRIYGWSLSLSLDYGSGDDVSIWIAGVHAGFEAELPFEFEFPVFGRVTAGGIGGALEVDASGFGDFEASLGVQGRVEIEAVLGSFGISLWGDFRYIEFEFDEIVTNGDLRAGGATFAGGAGLSLRF